MRDMGLYFENNFDLLQRAKYSRAYPVGVNSHFHDKHELYYLAHGNVKYFIDDKIYTLQSGDMVFIPQGVFHRTVYDSSKTAERLLISFDDEYIGEDYLEYVYELSHSHHIRISRDYSDALTDILRKIEYENKNKKSGYQKMEKLYLRELLIFISRHRISRIPEKVSEIHRLIQDAAQYISHNSAEDLTLTAVANKYCVSTGHFSKSFKKITGIRYSEYVNITRIATGARLLETTSLSVTEIASRCGFDDANYFASVFKKYKGITPKKYATQYEK